MVSPQKSRLLSSETSRTLQSCHFLCRCNKRARSHPKIFLTARKGEISPEKQWQSLRRRVKRNSASGNTQEQRLNSPKGHARSLYPTGSRLGRIFFFCGPFTQRSERTTAQPVPEGRGRSRPRPGAPRVGTPRAQTSFARTKPPMMTKHVTHVHQQLPSPWPPPPQPVP